MRTRTIFKLALTLVIYLIMYTVHFMRHEEINFKLPLTSNEYGYLVILLSLPLLSELVLSLILYRLNYYAVVTICNMVIFLCYSLPLYFVVIKFFVQIILYIIYLSIVKVRLRYQNG